MLVLVWVALAMMAKDAIGSLMVLAEARGRAVLAGGLDAASDAATIVSTAFGAGEIIVHGWNLRAVEILAVMMATSFAATTLSVRYGRRLTAHQETR